MRIRGAAFNQVGHPDNLLEGEWDRVFIFGIRVQVFIIINTIVFE